MDDGLRDELARTARRLDAWRRRRGGPGKRIPARIWEDAAKLARMAGVAPVARALRLNARRLEQEVAVREGIVDSGGPPSAEFVEVDVSRICGAWRTSVRLEGDDGRRVAIEVTGPECVDIAGIAAALWGRRT